MFNAIFLIVGIFFSVTGVVMIVKFVRQMAEMRNCYEIDARIVDYEEKRITHIHNGHKHTTITYAPVYEYVDFGETKRYTSDVSISVMPELGKEVTLSLSTGGKVYEKGSAVAALVLGIVCLIFGVAAVALGINLIK